MNKWIVLMVCLSGPPLWPGVPQQITYQGTLKQSNAAANGTYSMTFRLTDSGGLTQYWSSGPMAVTVTQGLFSVVLSPAGVDWANVTPYIEVNVNGQILLPRDPVTSTAYALECGSIQGMIAMFAGSCPAGWIHFTAMDGVFPMGGTTYGATGGSATHSHELLTERSATAGGAITVGVGQGGHGMAAWSGGSNIAIDAKQDLTDAKSNLPPYLTLVFCQKQ